MREGILNSNCIISAILNTDPKVQNIDNNKKLKLVEQYKNKFIVILKNKWKKENELLFMKENYDNWEDAEKVLQDCQNWQWIDLINYLVDYFRLNIITVNVNNPFEEPIINKYMNNKNYTIIIYNYNGEFNNIYDTNGNYRFNKGTALP